MNSATEFCNAAHNVMYLVGVVVTVIKIVVPIVLIVIGMTDLVKAMTSKNEDDIKKATRLLVKRVIIGVAIFLVPSIVGLLMNVIVESDYKQCMTCVTSPWGACGGWQD